MSYPRNGRPSRSTRESNFSYWLPLAITVSAAAVGAAVWIWSEGDDDDDSSMENAPDYVSREPPPYVHHVDIHRDNNGRSGENLNGYRSAPTSPPTQLESQSYMARMSGALRRTPSPQQIFDGASRSIVEGISAAGAVVGTALGSIIEEDRNAYRDHLTWSEEADARAAGIDSSHQSTPTTTLPNQPESIPAAALAPTIPKGKEKTIAIVLSAESYDTLIKDDAHSQEYATILSFLPQTHDFSNLRLLILIYAPLLKKHPSDAAATESPALAFSNIFENETHSPGNEPEKSSTSMASLAFNSVYSQAIGLVEKQTMVFPFTTATGHAQILRHLKPDIVYLQESLCGSDGEIITHLQAWLHQDIVVIVNDDSTSTDGASSENETKHLSLQEVWWKKQDRVGKGSGVVIIRAVQIGEDWIKRVENKK